MRVTDLLLPEVLEFEVSLEYHKSISFLCEVKFQTVLETDDATKIN